MEYYIIRNNTLKEYWVAEPKYSNQIEDIIKRFDGKFDIQCYPTLNIDEDIKIEVFRGKQKADHYLDWDLK